MRRSVSGRARALAVVTLAFAVLGTGVGAWARVTSTSTTQLTVSTGTILPPQPLSATVTCPNKNKGFVTLSWSSSPSPFTTSYVVNRATGTGAPVALASVSSATTSYTDSSVVGATTYTYSVTANYQLWVSEPVTVTVTTAKRC